MLSYLSRIFVRGNQNNVLQNIQNSTITITNVSNPEEIEALLHELHAIVSQKGSLQIIVLASTSHDFASDSLPCLPETHGNSPEDWKPYLQDNPIQELLQEFQSKAKIDLEILYVNGFQASKAWASDFVAKIVERTVLIVDVFSLTQHSRTSKENRIFASLFNQSKIGGFLVPICVSWKEEQKLLCEAQWNDLANGLFHLDTWWRESFDAQYMFIDLEIPHKTLLFRRLADIAFKHLEFEKPKAEFPKKQAFQDRVNKVSNEGIM